MDSNSCFSRTIAGVFPPNIGAITHLYIYFATTLFTVNNFIPKCCISSLSSALVSATAFQSEGELDFDLVIALPSFYFLAVIQIANDCRKF